MDASLDIEGAGPGGGRVREKLGMLTEFGWSAVPNALLMFQGKLGIQNDELVVFLNTLMHWHDPTNMPFPSAYTIAARMGVQVRTVQRVLNRLKKRGLLIRIKSRVRGRPDRYDVRPLLKQLEPLIREHRKQTPENSFEILPAPLLDHLANKAGIPESRSPSTFFVEEPDA